MDEDIKIDLKPMLKAVPTAAKRSRSHLEMLAMIVLALAALALLQTDTFEGKLVALAVLVAMMIVLK